MNDVLEYEELGEINQSAPLETFYEAMLPQLKNYGLTAQFPADKPSQAYSSDGIEHDVLIGKLPNAVRYLKWQASPYSNGGSELTLESEMLVHKITGGKLAFKIFISDSIAGMPCTAGNFNLILKFRGAKSEVEALRKAISPVLEKYNFQSHEVKNSLIITDNLEEKSNKNSNSELMTSNNVNFDELAQKSFAPGAGEADFENLFAAAFLLPEWHFIAVGEMPNLSPYCALFPDFFDDQPAVAVFTDTERAGKFMAESNTEFGSKNKPINLNYGDLTATISSENLILSVPTGNILDYIEKLIPKGIVKIFFNPNTDSHGFSNDLKIMRPIYEHLKNKNLLTQSADKIISEDTPQKSAETLIVQIKDGLGFPSGFVKASPDTLHLFCRVPPYWVDGGQLKPEYLEKIYAQLFGANWRMGNSDGSHYKILDSYTKIFDAETVKTTNFGGTVNQDNHQFFFYIGDKYDWIRKVTAEEFQADINAEMPTEKPYQFSKLVEENADVIADFERENALLSAMIAGSAAGMDAKSGNEKEQAISNMADIFEGVRIANNMPPKLFRVFIEACLKERKFLMPVLAFAYLQQDKKKWETLERDKEFVDEYARWLTTKLVPGAELLMDEPAQKSAALTEKEFENDEVKSAPANQSPKNANADAYFSIVQRGSVRADFSFAPVIGVILPLLENYRGTGEFTESFSPGTSENDTSDLVESFVSNAHGDCLKLKFYTFRRDGSEPPLEIKTLGSNRLKNVKTGELLIVRFTLHENPADAAQTKLIVNLLGSEGEVNKIFGAVKPTLDNFDYKILLETKGAPLSESLKLLEDVSDEDENKVEKSEFETNDAPENDSTTGVSSRENAVSVNFDELSKKAMETNAMEDLSALFGAAFALPEWNFISRGELPNVTPYVASNAAVADNQPMIRAFTDTERLMRFARENNLTEADGSAKMLTIPTENIIPYLEGFIPDGAFGVWFNADSESKDFFIPIKQLQLIKDHLAKLNQPPPSNLQNWGLAETPDGEIDLNLTVNKVGTVSFETSIAPFYEAIVSLLADYKGTNDYLTLLRFEPDGKSDEVENIAANSHGAYLQIRRFLYLNPKNGVRIGVNSVHSNQLRHVQTNAELLVSFELCKNLDNQTAVFYHAFQGPKSEVLKLSAAIQPLLEASGYQPVQ